MTDHIMHPLSAHENALDVIVLLVEPYFNGTQCSNPRS